MGEQAGLLRRCTAYLAAEVLYCMRKRRKTLNRHWTRCKMSTQTKRIWKRLRRESMAGAEYDSKTRSVGRLGESEDVGGEASSVDVCSKASRLTINRHMGS